MTTLNRPIKVASIWAQDTNGVLGSGTEMLWRVPADSQFFKASTEGSPVIMGRASWEALGRPLPNRTNIVVTRDRNYEAAGALVAHGLDEAFTLAFREAKGSGAGTVWVTGGGKIYEQTMDRVDELVVSQLDLTVPEGESPLVHAPQIDPAIWVADETRSDRHWRPESGDAKWKVITFVRRNPTAATNI